ncbi:MAG: membrane protein insertion efficiency factor YidD [Candidatus Dadabacteria bacterium]|nr:membrane protein insertion efficiency factor YidD [Candidatus Dadabacteria bacterium]
MEVYRTAVSPLLGPHCRFHPSCSQYAADALKTHGLKTGGFMALGRIARCHPLSRGGYDPVKPAK